MNTLEKNNFTIFQLNQIKSQEFKSWFGDWEKDLKNSSKVTKDGKPLVMIHETDWDMSKEGDYTFDRNKTEHDCHFFKSWESRPGYEYGNKKYYVYLNIRNPKYLYEDSYPFACQFEDDGEHDGVIWIDPKDNNKVVAVVYESNQIKSATDNNGNFSIESNKITEDIKSNIKNSDKDQIQKFAQLVSDYKYSLYGEKIIKKGNKWQVTDHTGKKNLGTYDTKKDAEERLKQVEMFKHMNEYTKKDFIEDVNDIEKEAINQYHADTNPLRKSAAEGKVAACEDIKELADNLPNTENINIDDDILNENESDGSYFGVTAADGGLIIGTISNDIDMVRKIRKSLADKYKEIFRIKRITNKEELIFNLTESYKLDEEDGANFSGSFSAQAPEHLKKVTDPSGNILSTSTEEQWEKIEESDPIKRPIILDSSKFNESKDHLINKLSITDEQKQRLIDFFKKYPNLESKIDWNRKDLEWKDFTELLDSEGKSKSQAKKKGLEGITEGKDYIIIDRKPGFIAYRPLTYLGSMTLASNKVPPVKENGAQWCISYQKTNQYWNNYINKGICFIFVCTEDTKYALVQYPSEQNFKQECFSFEDKKIDCPKEYKYLYNILLSEMKKEEEELKKNFKEKVLPSLYEVWKKKSIVEEIPEEYKKYITNIIIPDSVTSIGNGAFSGCTGLTDITIGNSVTNIGYSAFRGCTGLTSIEIPDSITSIGGSSFCYCTGLTSIIIPDSVTSIEEVAFYGCTGLTSIEIPNSVTSIGEAAFYGCTGLTSIEIPNSVTSIGNNAFYECTNLTIYYQGTKKQWKKVKGSGRIKRPVIFNSSKLNESSIIKESFMNEYKKLTESILDIPKKEYYDGVIKDDKMTPECRKQIIDTIKKWKEQINFDFNVYKIWAKGSLLTKRYNDTTDLDISIYTDMSKEQLDEIYDIIPKGQNIFVNGKETGHPLDFYVLTKGEHTALENLDCIYDVAHNKWVKRDDNYENDIPLEYVIQVANFFVNGCVVALSNYENDKLLYDYYRGLDPMKQEVSDDEKKEKLSAQKEKLKADLDGMRVALRMISNFRQDAYDEKDSNFLVLSIQDAIENPHVTINEQLAKILEKFGIRDKLRNCVQECQEILGIELQESMEKDKTKIAAFCFGRNNPPTKGHLHLWKSLSLVPADDHLIYTSHTQDKKKNPLNYSTKSSLIKMILKENNIKADFVDSDSRTLIDVAVDLYKKGYTDIVFLAGSDRAEDISNLLNKYNRVPNELGQAYDFNSISGISVGDRDPDSDGIEGVSASKVRKMALEGDFEGFCKDIPITDKFILKDVYDEIRSIMM